MPFTFQSYQQIFSKMRSKFLAETAINDFNKGSVVATFLEAASLEDFNQYYQMLQIINSFSLDNLTGEDLENRALDYGLTGGRLKAAKATSFVTIGDSSFEKISTKIYAGLAGPIVGQTFLYADSASNFPASGIIIVGRGTAKSETINYSSISPGLSYDTINLSSGLAFDHGTDETIILSQGGDRPISSGTVVKVPASDYSKDISFSIDVDSVLLDGENILYGVPITAIETGTNSNVPAGSINIFDSAPFASATVINSSSINNGLDIETDEQLRNRIRDTIQSLSRGTSKSIITGVVGIVDPDDNKRVVSASFIDAIAEGDVGKLIIDDGTGFEPSFSGRGYEEVVLNATGGEQFLQLDLYPLVKALAVSTNLEPYPIVSGDNLIYKVGNNTETVVFDDSDYRVPGAVLAQEIVAAINNKSTLLEARTTGEGKQVEIRAKTNKNEMIQVLGGTANSSNKLNFSTDVVETCRLYKYDGQYLTLLEKDGITASLENSIAASHFDMHNNPTYLDIQLDGETLFKSKATSSDSSVLIDYHLQSKFPNSSDLVGKYLTLTHLGISTTYSILTYNPITNTIGFSSSVAVSLNDSYQIESVERIYFSNLNGVDFQNPTQATLQEIVNVINGKLKNVASVSASGTQIILTSKISNNANSSIKVYPSSANSILGFPTTLVSGKNQDYILNRFNGQIYLIDALKSGESITAGTRQARAFLEASAFSPYVFTSSGSILIEIDEYPAQTINFSATTYSAQDAADLINASIKGATGYVTSDNRLGIRTNTSSISVNPGSIKIDSISGGSGGPTLFGFPVGVLISNLKSHNAFLISGNSENYNFVKDDRIVVVLDNDLTNKTFDIKMSLEGQVAIGGNPFTATISAINQAFSNKFKNDQDLKDFRLIWASGANNGIERNISNYTASGSITIDGTPLIISSGDSFVIIPKTADNVAVYLGNISTSTLSIGANVEPVVNGNKVQIMTSTDGSSGFVNVSGGTANGISSSFTRDSILLPTPTVYVSSSLWQIGMDVIVSDDLNPSGETTIISGVIPSPTYTGEYEITFTPTLTNVYAVNKNAVINRLNVLNFSTVKSQGADSYKYYTGLLRRVQQTVDGVDSDQAFPGIKAAGAQIEVSPPTVQYLTVNINLTTVPGLSISLLIDQVKNATATYINTLKIGEDVILAEIIKLAKSIDGITDVKIISPSANIPIADGELARINLQDIVVG